MIVLVERIFSRVCGLGNSPVLDDALVSKLRERCVEAHAGSACGSKLGDYFEVPKKGQLGSGTFGTVRVVRSKRSGQQYAAKVLRTTMHVDGLGNIVGADAGRLRCEIDALSAVRGHPHVLLLHTVFESRTVVYLITEMCAGGELNQLLSQQQLDDRQAQLVAIQLLDALAHLHSGPHYIMHRDVKLANIMLAQPRDVETLKLVDFGSCATFAADPSANSSPFRGSVAVGTRFYSSPEKLSSCYGAKADVWAAGVVLYIIGVPDVLGSERAQHAAADFMHRDALLQLLEQSQHAHLSEGFRGALGALLSVDIAKRPTASRAREQTAWLTGPCPGMPAVFSATAANLAPFSDSPLSEVEACTVVKSPRQSWVSFSKHDLRLLGIACLLFLIGFWCLWVAWMWTVPL